MWLRGRFITRRRRGTRQVKRSRDAVHRVARHVDQTFEETDRKNKEKFTKSTTTVKNCSQRRKTPKKMADRTQHEGKTERAKESHDRCTQPPGMHMPKTVDLGTQVLLVVNSFKLHLNAF